jgi:tetratricopeptide (TPR) repeat protein
MKQKIGSYVDTALYTLILLVAGLTPLIFTNLTTDFYETPKLIFLVVSTILAIGLWIFSWVIKGKMGINKTPLDIPLLLLLATVLISTYFSVSRYPAIFGNLTRMHGTAISYVAYILLFFVSVSVLKTPAKIKQFIYVLLGSGVVLAIISLLSYFKIFLPLDFSRSVNFTPAGSSFSAVAALLLLLPFPLFSIIKQNKYLPTGISLFISTLFSLVIVLLGNIPSYIILMAVYVLTLFIGEPAQAAKKLPLLLIPLVTTVLSLLLIYLPFSGNGLQKLSASFPREIQLPAGVSWKITASAFRDAPFFGTGPATYFFNFSNYKPAEFNLLKYWNFSFDTAQNEFFQILGTLGLFGLVSLFSAMFVVFKLVRRVLSKPEGESTDFSVIISALAISSILSLLILFIHVSTLVSTVISLSILAALIMSQSSIREKVSELSVGIKASTADNHQTDLLPLIVFVAFAVLAVPTLIKTFNYISADVYHRKALVEASKSANQTYQYLQKAESLNPYVDLYRIDMAQTNFGLANAIALQKGPTQANPKGSLTDSDKQTIQTLLSQAITEGRVSVAISPLSARNWELLGSIYRNMSGVANNALTFSLDAYGRAIQRDPTNPALRVNVGGIYYSAKNYAMANRFFSDAINLKPDYVNAYYNLAITLKDSGDLANARLIAEQAVSLLQTDVNSQDYKTASTLLEDLKAKIAANTKNQPTAPAGQPNSALGNSNMPDINVPDLNNPPEPSTPAAVKNPEVTLPTGNNQ